MPEAKKDVGALRCADRMKTSRRWRPWALLVLTSASGLLSRGCSAPRPSLATAPPTQARELDPMLRKTLAILATGSPTAPALSAATGIAAEQTLERQVERYVDALLADASFSRQVVPRILFKDALTRRPWLIGQAYILEHAESSDGPIYYLRQRCGAEAAIKVRPWWDMDSEVLVCADSYQPTQFVMGGTRHCDTRHEADPPTCGCGPSLMRCFKDRHQQQDFAQSVHNEVIETTSWIVEHERPIQTLFTAKETVRDRNAEFLYQRWRVEAGETSTLGDYRAWPAAGVWAPRHESAPGQHAGVLTTPQVLYLETDTRQRQKIIYDLMWCKEPISGGAATQAMLSLGTSNFQVKGDLWRNLAGRPVCTSCHARLDYGMQFFSGYADARVAAHFDPAAQLARKGPLYGNDIHDLRGEAELAPHGFAELAIRQKEFAECMVRDVEEHVFGYRSTPDIRDALAAAFARGGSFRELMRAALLRYVAQWQRPAAPPLARSMHNDPDATAAAPPGAPDVVTASPRLRQLLDRHCVLCHDEGERDFRTDQLPRTTVEKMLAQVAFGGMPKGASRMEPASRRDMVQLLIDKLWTEREARAQASSYFLTWRRAASVHHIDAAMNVVHAQAGAAPRKGSWRYAESVARPHVAQYTPGFTAITAIEALRACKAAGHSGEELDRCLERATSPSNFIH